MLQTMRSGGLQHPEEIINFLASQLVLSGGIINKTLGDMLVAQQTVPNMSVKVPVGHAFLKKAGSEMAYPVRLTADASVVIGANSSGNSRKDAIVLYIDLGATPNSDITNVAKLVAIQGTPAASPTAPDNTAIEAAIGASNPYLRLADVTVASGAASILTANILDQRADVVFSSYAVPTAAYHLANKAYVDLMAPLNGWVLFASAGIRVDANTMKLAGDYTTILRKGDKVMLTDTTTKYFYITADPTFDGTNTSLVIYAGSDFTLVGTPSNIYISKHDSPVGFPDSFNWVPTLSPSGGSITSQTITSAKFSMIGKRIFINTSIRVQVSGTCYGVYATLPINAASADLGGVTGVLLGGNVQRSEMRLNSTQQQMYYNGNTAMPTATNLDLLHMYSYVMA